MLGFQSRTSAISDCLEVDFYTALIRSPFAIGNQEKSLILFRFQNCHQALSGYKVKEGEGRGAFLLQPTSPRPHYPAHLFSSLFNSGFHPESLIVEIIKTIGANSGGGNGL